MMEIKPTKTVRLFADGSELLYLSGEDRYVWQRLKPDGTGYEEVAVPGENDQEALTECGKIAYAEQLRHRKGGE